MGDPCYQRESVRALEFMIPECKPDLNCIVHDSDLPFPNYLTDIDWHLIVLGPTFLCNRYRASALSEAKRKYDFVKRSSACKIALPQDDYDCSEILDDWMVDWGIDLIYSVCPDHWETLYPQSYFTKDIRLGYTGYITDQWIESSKNPKDHSERTIDVSYRASKLPANFGRTGQLKWEIARRFLAAIDGQNQLRLDISVSPDDLIPGTAWHAFMENSKFCLVTPSGSSIIDPRNQIRACVNKTLSRRPDAAFDEIMQLCVPVENTRYLFTAISPRNIEAALLETVQIATLGSYSGLMSPNEHFILLNEDCSNISDVMSALKDQCLVNKMRIQCKEVILSEPRLRQDIFVSELIDYAENVLGQRNVLVADCESNRRQSQRYRLEIIETSERYWRRARLMRKLRTAALKLGAKRLKDYFFSTL